MPIEQFAVVGHSVGAAIVAAWIHDYAPRLRAAVLATPAFRIRLYLPLGDPVASDGAEAAHHEIRAELREGSGADPRSGAADPS